MEEQQVSIIVAASANHAIGRDNQLLWHLPQDMRFFKNTTWAMPVIMGRKTYESLGKPLGGRRNIVITRQTQLTAEGVETAASLEEALKLANSSAAREVFIIGGGEVYAQALPLASTIYLTRVHTVVEDADTFFAMPGPSEWDCVFSRDFGPDEKHAYGYSFQTWKRKPVKQAGNS